MIQLLRKTVQRFLRKLKIELPYDPEIPSYPFLIYTKNENTDLKNTCIPIFIAALFTVAKIWSNLSVH